MQQSNISAIFGKIKLFNFGQIINHLLLPFPMFQPPYPPGNNAIWHSFQNLMCNCCICPVWKMCRFFVLPKPNSHWICRHHVGGRPRGFRRDGRRAKPLPGNAACAGRNIPQIGFLPDRRSTPGWRCFHNNFCPIVTPFHNVAHPGRLASRHIFHLGLCGVVFPATSPPGSEGTWPASGARSTATHA